MVEDIESRLVVARGEKRLRDARAHAVAEALAERTGRHLDAGRELALGMARRDALPLAEMLDLIERDRVAGEVQHAVEQHGPVAGGGSEAVAVGPVGIFGIML